MKLTQKDFKGMVTTTTQGKIPPNACREMQNCILEHGLVKTRHGFKKSGTQMYDKVLGMFNYRGALHGHEQLLMFTDNVTRDGLTDNGGLLLMPSIDIGSDYADNVAVWWDYQELWDYIRVEVAAANPTWTDAQIDAETDTLTDAEIYTDGAHWTYNAVTDEWDYSASGIIEQNDIPDSIMPDDLKPELPAITEDATTYIDAPDRNEDTSPLVLAQGGTARRIFIKTPAGAQTLYLYRIYDVANFPNPFPLGVYETTTDWDESTITWNNQPDLGTELDTVTITNGTAGWKAFSTGGVASVCIKAIDESETGLIYYWKFYHSEYVTDPSLRPYVEY